MAAYYLGIFETDGNNLFDPSIFTGIDVASDGPGRVAAGNYVVRHGRTFFRRMFVSPGARGTGHG
ncbi:hypothetical protein, partial [Burkholderia cenocepacia]|uniref:hypothetical protein n=1 Tax=Burkholderia cenocepacia TaxID=95486 RepID=UPI001C4DE478